MDPLTKAKEYLGKEVTLIIDHPVGTKHPQLGFTYEANYGYVPGTKAKDKHEIDAYFLGEMKPLDEADGVVIAIIKHLENEDHKLIVVAKGKTLTDEEIAKAVDFQEKFGKHEILR
jgi:inorganic pyrophosphatase